MKRKRDVFDGEDGRNAEAGPETFNLKKWSRAGHEDQESRLS
jgi:hypothetical protein